MMSVDLEMEFWKTHLDVARIQARTLADAAKQAEQTYQGLKKYVKMKKAKKAPPIRKD